MGMLSWNWYFKKSLKLFYVIPTCYSIIFPMAYYKKLIFLSLSRRTCAFGNSLSGSSYFWQIGLPLPIPVCPHLRKFTCCCLYMGFLLKVSLQKGLCHFKKPWSRWPQACRQFHWRRLRGDLVVNAGVGEIVPMAGRLLGDGLMWALKASSNLDTWWDCGGVAWEEREPLTASPHSAHSRPASRQPLRVSGKAEKVADLDMAMHSSAWMSLCVCVRVLM